MIDLNVQLASRDPSAAGDGERGNDNAMSFTPGPWEVVHHHHVDSELWLSVNQHADRPGESRRSCST